MVQRLLEKFVVHVVTGREGSENERPMSHRPRRDIAVNKVIMKTERNASP